MDIIIMGEETQEICKAFLAKGHNAFSCDLQPCSGGRPDRHIHGDMWEAFYSRHWDMAIVHIVCTYMSNSGSLRLYKGGRKVNGVDPDRWAKMEQSTKDFNRALLLPVDKLILENPIMHCHASSRIIKPYTQTIQPHEYGHPESKRTCLWLKGLQPLKPTNILPLPECGYWDNQTKSGQNKLPPSPERGKLRSKTYKGWADAMADQYGGNIALQPGTQQLDLFTAA